MHSDLPFCSENIKPYHFSKCKKLVASLHDKKNYVIHYRVLQQCIQNGLILKKIHKVLEFKQAPWLKEYIDLNNAQRTLSTNDFQKNLFKLMNNSVYGKTMENVDKRKDVKLVCGWESEGKVQKARALIAKPNFHSSTHFSEDLVAIQLKRMYAFYNKPMYLGFTVLELSKWK
ncbi:hypothetical protein PSTG_18051, partial [Puccinia striiformis f. sp. tritici PST-78]